MGRLLLLTICAITLFSSCGYQFQGRHNPLRELGVEKVYVAQFRNDTYRAGVEQLFSAAMIREIQKSRSFQLVSSEKEADAILTGVVTTADGNPTSFKSQKIDPNKTVDVASEYSAGVTCAIKLTDRNKRVIFGQTIGSTKLYPGSAEIGDKGATVSLVNESEQRLAIQFLASQMMASVHQRMIDTF